MSACCSIIGIQMSVRCPMMSPANVAEATPTMVSGTPLIVIECPTADLSPAKRLSQYA